MPFCNEVFFIILTCNDSLPKFFFLETMIINNPNIR